MRALAIALAALLLLPALARAQTSASDPASDPRNFTWEQKGVLAVGGGGLTNDDITWLAAQGFGAIADFRAEHDDGADAVHAAGMDYLYLPVDHVTDINVTQLRTFLAWAAAEQAAGKPMYVHCTNGWHRAAAFAIAWVMAHENKTMDAATSEVAARRPGTELRAPGALLQLDAQLHGRDALLVTLESSAARPPPGGTTAVIARVWANGQPLAGATVRLATETRRVDETATTDASGAASFDFPAPSDSTFMDYLTARASAPGHGDGADIVEVFYGIDVPPPSGLAVQAQADGSGVSVALSKQGGPLHARIVLTAPGGWSAWESTPLPHARLPGPPAGGDISVRVESWGAPAVTTTVGALPAQAPPPPPTTTTASPQPPNARAPAPPEKEVAMPASPPASAPPTATPATAPTLAPDAPPPPAAPARAADARLALAGVAALALFGVAAAVMLGTRRFLTRR